MRLQKVEGHFSYKQLVSFFLPLGLSASLTGITHVIINGTLSRGEDAAFIIACYAVAFSLFGIIERPMIVFRQTCSALVKDKQSFRQLTIFLLYVMSIVLIFCFLTAFTEVGDWVFIHWFNADPNMVVTISNTFKVITLVIILSGIRAIFQGVIINQLKTNWLTVMVIVRLATMFFVSYLFIVFDYVTSMVGAIIFLTGMVIETIISVWKGKPLLKNKPAVTSKLRMPDITSFYMPLLLYLLVQNILTPVIYIFLSQTNDIEMGIASFALALSITQMLLSFYMYTHQIVLQFYEKNKQKVVKFTIVISLLPALLIILLCYSPVGLWFMQVIMGAEEPLATTTLNVLQFFIVKTLVFPWIDFLCGFFMLRRKTKKLVVAQMLNLVTVVLVLLVLINYFPNWNGVNGSIAASMGELVGLVAVIIVFYRMVKREKLAAKQKLQARA